MPLSDTAYIQKNSFNFQRKEIEIVLPDVLDYQRARELRENGFLLKRGLV